MGGERQRRGLRESRRHAGEVNPVARPGRRALAHSRAAVAGGDWQEMTRCGRARRRCDRSRLWPRLAPTFAAKLSRVAVIYRTSPHGLPTEAGVIVVHCSDPRYQWHFHEFLRNGLGIREYGLVAVPGGPQALARLEFMPKFSWSGWRWLKFLIDLTKPERVVLINHDDCRWYWSTLRATDPARVRERQLADLRSIQREFSDRFNVQIEAYYARLDDGAASFERVDA